MKIGDTFQTADCERCGQQIKHVFWGNAGNLWRHADGRLRCWQAPIAHPRPGSIHEVEGGISP